MYNDWRRNPATLLSISAPMGIGCVYCREDPGQCPQCHGVGKVPTVQVKAGPVRPEKCLYCDGTGKCPICKGRLHRQGG